MPGLQRLTQDGYKILKRYNDVGLEALTDCSRQWRICEKKPGIAVGPFSLCVSEELEVHATHATHAACRVARPHVKRTALPPVLESPLKIPSGAKLACRELLLPREMVVEGRTEQSRQAEYDRLGLRHASPGQKLSDDGHGSASALWRNETRGLTSPIKVTSRFAGLIRMEEQSRGLNH